MPLTLDLSFYHPSAEEDNLLKEYEESTMCEMISEQGLQYVTGFVAHKFRCKYKMIDTTIADEVILYLIKTLTFNRLKNWNRKIYVNSRRNKKKCIKLQIKNNFL
ncbi:hypothetical protein ALC62_03145 [Cyphomyrmex costatus]|uniref:Uncharacterized protein n=1 Tax=Cyphomyrmex costatus TaxID=456900 RepID=A0A151ILW4_9HYME|nr:hypothetical protein ALC62_03145 [Cyphomyrmex costatus]